MANPDIHKEWEATLQKYGNYLCIDLDEQWRLTHTQLIAYMDKEKKSPSQADKNPEIKKLGSWLSAQKKNFAKNFNIMSKPDIRLEWESTLQKYGDYLSVGDEQWRLMHTQLIAYMDKEKKRPLGTDKNAKIKKLGQWVTHQKTNYLKNLQIMSNPAIRKEWEATLQKYPEYLKQSIIPQPEALATPAEPTQPTPPKKKRKLILKQQTTIPVATQVTTTSVPHHFAPPSAIGILHKTYKRMGSATLHQKFKADPQLWLDYHATRKQTFATYDPKSIPSNRIIQELEKIQTKRQKVVVDMGCGEAPIAHHFLNKNDTRFAFHNYDHHSGGDQMIQEVNISTLPLQDNTVEIAIMSLALWGTHENCVQYIKEAYRVLESGGKFYISDSTKKWSPDQLTQANAGEILRTLLISNGFNIITEDIGMPFCLFVCNKIY